MFGIFIQIVEFLQQYAKSVSRQDSNSQHLDYESHPLTTKPGLGSSLLF